MRTGFQNWLLLWLHHTTHIHQLVVQAPWEQLTAIDAHRLREEPSQRIFIHLDYILSENMQERVDDLQEQIE